MQAALDVMTPRSGETMNAIFDMINAVPGLGPVLMLLTVLLIFGFPRLVKFFSNKS